MKFEFKVTRYVEEGLGVNLRLMTSKKAYLGWSHSRGERGDGVCILHDCHLPVVLHQRYRGGYTFVGDAFVENLIRLRESDLDSKESPKDMILDLGDKRED